MTGGPLSSARYLPRSSTGVLSPERALARASLPTSRSPASARNPHSSRGSTTGRTLERRHSFDYWVDDLAPCAGSHPRHLHDSAASCAGFAVGSRPATQQPQGSNSARRTPATTPLRGSVRAHSQSPIPCRSPITDHERVSDIPELQTGDILEWFLQMRNL